MSFPMVPLGKVIQYRNDFIEINDLEQYKRCRVQLHAQGIVLRDIVPGAEIKTKKQQVCRVGEFLVAEIDAKVGGFGIVPPELDGAIVSSHYFLFVIDETRLDRKFLDFFIRTPFFREQVKAQGSTNYAAIRPADVLSYSVPLPPLPEQQRIVTRIEQLAAKIEEAKRLSNSTYKKTSSLIQHVSYEILKKKEKQGYIWKKLDEVTEISAGGTPSRSIIEYWENGIIPWVKISDIPEDGIVLGTEEKITESGLKNSSAKLFPIGTLLFTIFATIGKVGILGIEAATNQAIACIRIKEQETIDSNYLLYCLKSLRQLIAEKKRGGAQDNINQTILKKLEIPFPPLPEQHRIVAYLGDLEAKVDAMRKLQAETKTELDALMPSILDRAFRGELV